MALTAGGRLAELQIVRRDRPSPVDSVFLGRLERVMPDLDAAFVDIGIGRSGFLRAEDRAGIDGWPPAGAPVLVQVRNDGEGDKGPAAVDECRGVRPLPRLSPAGVGRELLAAHRRRVRARAAGAAMSPTCSRAASCCAPRPPASSADVLRADANAGHGALGADPPPRASTRRRRPISRRAFPASAIRSNACCATTAPALEEVILDDRAMARALQDEMDRRGRRSACAGTTAPMPAFDIDDVAGQIDTALAPRIALASGVEVLFEPGETLCAVDVDSAGAGGRQGRAPRRPVEVNLEAAPAIAQQLRLRNLAGAVVIDFVTMRSTYDRDKVQAALAEVLRDDLGADASLRLHPARPLRVDARPAGRDARRPTRGAREGR